MHEGNDFSAKTLGKSRFHLRVSFDKLHVYGKRQTAKVRFKLRISQNRKYADKNSSKQLLWIKKLRETTNLCVEIMNSKRQVKGKIGHVVFRLT